MKKPPDFTAEAALGAPTKPFITTAYHVPGDAAVRPQQIVLDCGGPVACLNHVWYCACFCQSFPGAPPYNCYEPCGSC
jgi:hypothetical protein